MAEKRTRPRWKNQMLNYLRGVGSFWKEKKNLEHNGSRLSHNGDFRRRKGFFLKINMNKPRDGVASTLLHTAGR